ncbi:diguanylate cyclase [Caulobacter sp. 17J65-9]|uniref:diguanylate cyclase domain-containing protein n=1 Tax=Caulobacter sp. 17J65-9 TaxID=2709382 RepID=UPI0013C8A91C|nr:diguanylate cyclase [Caulobacter sp. 17J65-9]
MALNARVLIVASDDGLAGPLAEGLDRLGWSTVTASGPFAAVAALQDLEIEAAVVDVAGHEPELYDFGRRLKEACAPRRIPVMAIGVPAAPLDPTAYDLQLAPPLHPVQIALRLEQLVRTAVAEEEFELRQETFTERDAPLASPQEQARPVQVLTVGDPAPKFLALANALQQCGAEVVGAFTPYTAFDYMHDRPFDAVVLWGGEDHGEALAIASGMRRNTRLYHVPNLLYVRSPDQLDLAEVFNRGVTDIAGPNVPEMQTAQRIVALAKAYRRQIGVREALDKARGSGLMDSATGLFSRDLFAAHLAKLTTAARGRNRPLSVCLLKVADRPEVTRARDDGWLDKAMPQIGSMISRLVRSEDTAARLAPEVFALALPATAQGAARLVGERIAAVIGCTAFEAGPGLAPFVAEFEVGTAQLLPGETPAQALERAAAETLQRRAG